MNQFRPSVTKPLSPTVSSVIMKHILPLLTLTILAVPTSGAPYQDRLVWVFGWGLGKDSDVAEITQVLETAKAHGINGAVLSAGLDSLGRQSPDYFRRLGEVRKNCDRLGLELIPSVFSVGYGGGALGYDRNLAEGVPVRDAPFLVKDRQAAFVAEHATCLINGGFEEYTSNHIKGFDFHDQPGEISFIDTEVRHGGKASLRLENFQKNPYGHGRIMQEITVRPHRCYRLSLWVKTQGLKPQGCFQVLALVKNRELAPRQFTLPSTSGWRKLTLLFNSLEYDHIRLYAGVWGGKEGKVWVDDWTVEEVGPLNVLHRPGTPVTVRSEDGQVTYAEGQDYELLTDPQFQFNRVDRQAPALRLTTGSRIRESQRLRVSWYHPMVIHEGQITVCMGEPKLYEIYDREAKLLAEHLHPRRVLLNMDEVRMGGTCEACQGQDMGKLLGDCITRQVQILRRHLPGLEVYIWSDMLDPHHNAHGDYYLVKGSFADSWKHVPKDLIIAVWGGQPREKSLRFFSEQGFQTMVACYYDADDLKEVEGWLKVAHNRVGVRGFMYTPWQKKYQLLPAFGDLLKEPP